MLCVCKLNWPDLLSGKAALCQITSALIWQKSVADETSNAKPMR